MKRSSLRPGKKCSLCLGKGCASCQMRGWLMPAKKPKKPVKKVRARTAKANSQYSSLRKAFLETHPRCLILGPTGICGAISTDVHHRKGRGKYMLDESTWIACCNSCHLQKIHHYPAWAKKMGYLVNPISIAPLPEISKTFIPYES